MTTLDKKPSETKPWKKYYSKESLSAEVPECTAYQYLKEMNKLYTEQTALSYYGRNISFNDFFKRIDECADAFFGLGVKNGDIVSLLTVSVPETVVAIYALNKLGATANTIDPRMDIDSIKRMVQESKSKILITLDLAFSKVRRIKQEIGQQYIIVQSAFSSLLPVARVYKTITEDWAATLVENGAKADEVIDTILTTAVEIVNYNLDEEIVNIAAPYTEELVFNTVAYLINNIKSLEAIKAINPDALIAVVGLNNPVKGLTANINGEAINLGEYVEYFIEATNVYNTIYAAASENVIFVEADGAEIAGYQGAINIDTSDLSTIDNTLLQLLYNNSFANSTVVTEAGHNYIANQIKAAITLVDHIDADNDDICDKCGENLASSTPSRPRPGGSGGSTIKEETPVTSTFKFTDVSKDAWYYDTVKKVVEKGLMNGISETQFAPELDVTRGMFVTILYRAAGEPQVSVTTNFADVSADKYYAKAVAWANANGIVKGITETEFAPDNNITREQMAAILYRYAKNKAATGEITYTDKHAISDYAMEAVAWAKAAGIMEGNADGTFAPLRNASRAEAAAVFVRMFKL